MLIMYAKAEHETALFLFEKGLIVEIKMKNTELFLK